MTKFNPTLLGFTDEKKPGQNWFKKEINAKDFYRLAYYPEKDAWLGIKAYFTLSGELKTTEYFSYTVVNSHDEGIKLLLEHKIISPIRNLKTFSLWGGTPA